MIRIYVAAAVLAVALLGWWRYDYVVSERDGLKSDLAASRADLENRDNIIRKERADAVSANFRAEAYATEKRTIENEAKSMRDCINNQSCGVRVQWKFKVCPSLPNASSGESRTDGAAEPDTRNLEEWSVGVEESIKLNLLQIEKLQEDIKIRSHPNYCKPQ